MATPAEIAASLSMDDIPVKLRCAACNKLANNAFRMPCCDQTICEDCQASLPQACPVCLHEPIKADDCRPNKALRTTIKVFLRKKGMERETAKKKEAMDKAAAAPVIPAIPRPKETSALQPSQTPAPTALATISNDANARDGSGDISQAPQGTVKSNPKAGESSLPTEAQEDIPQQSIESPGPQQMRRASTQTAGSVSQGKSDEKEQQQQQLQSTNQNEQWASGNGVGQATNGGGFGYDNMNSNLPNMGFNATGDFNTMMQMMPNALQNNMMGQFPNVMGMPGMGMDPMAMSQGMYGGFGGPGIGMNGMNMGMGFNAGQGAFGGYNGQPGAWNTGQDQFNQNKYGGHANGMGGDYGANAGYGGYNMPPHQGNFNQMNNHHYSNNDYSQRGHNGPGFQNRGRARGRGFGYSGRGRGGYGQNQVVQGNQANNQPFNHQLPDQVIRRGSPKYTPMNGQQADSRRQETDGETQQDIKIEGAAAQQLAEEQLNKELNPGDADDIEEERKASEPKDEPKDQKPEDITGSNKEETKPLDQPAADVTPLKEEIREEEIKPSPIETFVSSDVPEPEVSNAESKVVVPPAMMPPTSPIVPTGPAVRPGPEQLVEISPRGRGLGRGFHRGAPDHRGQSQGRGLPHPSNGTTVLPQVTPLVDKFHFAPKGLGVEGAPKGPKALREGLSITGVRDGRGFSIVGRASAAAQTRPNGDTKVKSPSPTRSRSRSRSPSRQQSSFHRHHRHRSSSLSKDNEREKRRERHRHHTRIHEDEDLDFHESKTPRKRDISASSSTKRSSHRSHRDRDKDRHSERSTHHSHRSHRERSKEPKSEYRSSRKRSRTPEHRINGASRLTKDPSKTNGIPTAVDALGSRRKEKEDSDPRLSRKRRDRDPADDNDGDHHHSERKRSKTKRDDSPLAQEIPQGPSRTNARTDKYTSNTSKTRTHENPSKKSSLQERVVEPPKGPKVDQHALEREARNRERQMKELQRRALAGGPGGVGGKGRERGTGRRVSIKYEDEEGGVGRGVERGEKEREAGRWG